MMGLATPAPNMWESSVEEMMEATGDTLLENLHQRDLPVSQRRRQPTPTKNTVAHVTGEALSRTQPMKLHSVSWPRPKHREVQMIPLPTLVGAEEAERGSSELVPAAAGSVSWGAAAAQTRCGSSCRRCWPRALLRALSGLSPAAQGCRWSAPESSPAAPQWPVAAAGAQLCRAGPGGAGAQLPPWRRNALKLMYSVPSCQC